MSDTGTVRKTNRKTIKSDQDLVKYLKTRWRATEGELSQSPVLEYASRRDFEVEPLETHTTAYLINVLVTDTSAQAETDFVLECWVPDHAGRKEELEVKLDKWGYDVVRRSRTNRSKRRTPLINYTAKKSPSPVAQFRALCEVEPEPSELLDGWVLVIQNQSRPPNEQITVEEWASIRGVPIKEVEENMSGLGDALKENGGLPGSQWEIQNSGGVRITG